MIFLILHSYLVAIVNERYAGHGEEEGHRHFQLLGGVAGTDVVPLKIVVTRRYGYVAPVFCFGV